MTDVIDEVLAATKAEELFGTGPMPQRKKKYRELARNSHPDRFSTTKGKRRAEEAFIHLNELWNDGHTTVTVGASTPRTASKAGSSRPIIQSKKHKYLLGEEQAGTDVFRRFNAEYDGGHEFAELLVTKAPTDTDFADAAVTALKRLNSDTPKDYKYFYPQLLERFRYASDDGTQRSVIALDRFDFEFFTLKQVKEAFPEGVPARDFAWMFRRMLIAVGNAHDVGLIHGAPNLGSFVIQPEQHGVILRDWEYSVELPADGQGEPLKAVPAEYKSWYPKSVFNKEPVDASLDIILVAKTAQELLGDTSPKQFKAFVKGCQLSTAPGAGTLLSEFDEIIERMWGERTFHEFRMPKA